MLLTRRSIWQRSRYWYTWCHWPSWNSQNSYEEYETSRWCWLRTGTDTTKANLNFCRTDVIRCVDISTLIVRYEQVYCIPVLTSWTVHSYLITRIHSSRMHTARSLPYRGDVSVRGGSLSRGWGSLSGRPLPGQRLPPPVNRMTDASKNITLPQSSFAGGNYD